MKPKSPFKKGDLVRSTQNAGYVYRVIRSNAKTTTVALVNNPTARDSCSTDILRHVMSKKKPAGETLTFNLDGMTLTVLRSDYVFAKTKQLREFGYSRLTEAETEKQLAKLFAGKRLSIIGMMMEGEVILPPTDSAK